MHACIFLLLGAWRIFFCFRELGKADHYQNFERFQFMSIIWWEKVPKGSLTSKLINCWSTLLIKIQHVEQQLINFVDFIQHVDQLLINMLIYFIFQLVDQLLFNMLLSSFLLDYSTSWSTVDQHWHINFNMLINCWSTFGT